MSCPQSPHVTRSLFLSLGVGPAPVVMCLYDASDLFPDVQAMQHVRKQVGGIVHTHNDRGRSDAKGEGERARDVWGLWAGDSDGITCFPPHDSAREGKGEGVGMDGCGHGGEEQKMYDFTRW